MIPKNERYSFKKGIPRRLFHSSFFTLRFELGGDKLSLGVVTSKRVDKLATKRNAIRRKFLNIVYNCLKKQNVKGNFLFYLKPEAKSVEEEKILEALKEAFSKTQNNV